MNSHPLYGKRKKKITRCPNALFAQWLTEWREDAMAKNIKTQYVYGKALKSLQKFPLLLKTGKDCKILENFGDKICKMLDDKLNEYISINGTDALTSHLDTDDEKPQVKKTSKAKPKPPAATTGQQRTCHMMSDSDSDGDGQNELPILKKTSKPKIKTNTDPTAPPNQHSCHLISDSDNNDDRDDQLHSPPRKRQRSGRKSGEYIPVYRSGPYAILLALYQNMQLPDSRGFMTKADLFRVAQPLADKSFTIPDPGCRYTAWSSMGTLIKKGLVLKESSPAKYCLTDAGCELAHKLEHVLDHTSLNTTQTCNNSVPPIDRVPPPVPDIPRRVADPVTSNLEFSYVSDDGKEVRYKDKAAVLIDDDMGIGFLIKCNYQKLLASAKQYRLDTSRPLGDEVYAYIHNDDAPELALGIDESDLPSLNPSMLNTAVSNVSNLAKESQASRNTQNKNKPLKKTTANPGNRLASAHSGPQLLPLIDSLPELPPQTLLSSMSDSQDSQNSIQSISSTSSSTKSLPDPDFVLSPGMFEIVLCIDNQEFYGASKGGSKNLLPDLMKNGVNCDLRKLQVGDILWVAQEKTSAVQGQLVKPQSRELVLDYIIERKRMDDLVHSCTDGRLPDQKFRLKHCGLRRPIFLIEDYGSMQHFSMPEERVRQTITNLKVIDGFEVKRTKDSKETVAYLTVMTRYLQSFFRTKTLHASKRDDLQEFGWFDINDGEQRLMTFPEFNQGSIKSKALTVQETFGKQLIQIHGMSAEKAKAITQVYPTITHLYQAYENCRNEKEKEVMINNIKCGKSMRSLGLSQSRQIYQLYCTTGPLTK